MKTEIRRLARQLFYTSNTLRYRVELPRLIEALRQIGSVDFAVDVGAAGGFYAVNAYAKYSRRLVAIEPDPALCALLDREIASLGAKASWIKGSMLDIPIESEKADLVATTQVLERIPDHRTAVKELARILKPAGHLLITVPQPPAPWPEGGHVREGYYIDDLVSLVQPFGLELRHQDYFLTRSTQELMLRAHRLKNFLPAIFPIRELTLSREQRLHDSPYGLLGLFQKE
jgi:ubiquinone/menaquinone biosynthesis C-methylase UbiE